MALDLGLVVASVLAGMIPRAMPALLAATGEAVDEIGGVLNLGVEGIMLMGAIIGFLVDYWTGSVLIAFVCAAGIGMLFSFFHGVASISLKADQVVSGTAIWFIGWGLSGVLYVAAFGFTTSPVRVNTLPSISIPYLTSLPYVGQLLFGENPIFYLTLVLLFGVQYFLYHTKPGLNLRTVGENPRVAEVMGVNPTKYRYAGVLFGGMFAGIGGAYLTLVLVGSFDYDMTAGIGFVAVALVLFGKWRPWRVFIGALVFGAIYVLYLTLESVLPSFPYQFLAMWPYLATLGFIMVVGKRANPPAALATPYRKEE
jgi:simple sugar transport system permease protein